MLSAMQASAVLGAVIAPGAVPEVLAWLGWV